MRSVFVRALQWLGYVVLCNGVGFASAMVANEPSFYERLVRPSWAPPASVFGPVWTILYTLMGTATWIVWARTRGHARRQAMALFAIQLALNAAWTPVFFGLHLLGASIFVIAAVLIAVVVMMVTYARSVPWAGALIAPLGLWVGFATCLNVALWWGNR